MKDIISKNQDSIINSSEQAAASFNIQDIIQSFRKIKLETINENSENEIINKEDNNFIYIDNITNNNIKSEKRRFSESPQKTEYFFIDETPSEICFGLNAKKINRKMVKSQSVTKNLCPSPTFIDYKFDFNEKSNLSHKRRKL